MEPHMFAGKSGYGHTGGSFSSGAWLTYFPDEKLALAYTTNAKIYPVRNIVSGVFDIYWNRPFQIPTFEAFDVSPEVLDRYVGVYSVAGTPAKVKVTRVDRRFTFSRLGKPLSPSKRRQRTSSRSNLSSFSNSCRERRVDHQSCRSKEDFHKGKVIGLCAGPYRAPVATASANPPSIFPESSRSSAAPSPR